ncbi:hypothetical protein [Gloeocapsa sp. PCC 73106]|uniref:hypothetical protein n=1 Tax=Gloeocapsa sp. PCC 73106 TaxID=102232 RepID=UPI0002AC8B25|nr:hypothetical protein [Gloeocapsa sp. PCC 73106]ELR98573.1 hypothetical protein GLO73106DRAFT_00024070 [Gloeocapsa sp. PCC 73106]
MYAELKELLYDAEDHYLQSGEIENLRQQVDSLQQRLKIYKYLRDQEIEIFQAIADQLEGEITPEAILQWVAVLRYVAMGMLLNSFEFLHRRILEWLNSFIQAHDRVSLDSRIHQLLCDHLKKTLTPEQWRILQPFLFEVQTTILR